MDILGKSGVIRLLSGTVIYFFRDNARLLGAWLCDEVGWTPQKKCAKTYELKNERKKHSLL